MKKNYYCYNYEDESNVKYRKEFIEKYFKYEQNTYWWVHLEEPQAIELEKSNNVKLLENISIEFDQNNKKMREYHVDTHPIFSSSMLKKIIHP